MIQRMTMFVDPSLAPNQYNSSTNSAANNHPNSQFHSPSSTPLRRHMRHTASPSPLVQQPSINRHSSNMRQSSTFTQRSGSLHFQYQGSTYELRDNQYAKHSADLREVNNKTDLVHFYEEMQSDAITYNIFLQQFDLLKSWQKYITNTLPPTCIFDDLTINDNTIEAYNRMKNAIYTKLTKSTINDAEYKAIIKHGSIGKDGFEILYELMTHCHPKLMVATSKLRDTNPRPHIDDQESVYSYLEKLTTWLTIEQINGLQHSDNQVLNIVMEEMSTDSKYEAAIQGINAELTIHDTFQRMHGPKDLPENLKLYNLPSTILSFYNKEDRNTLFPTDESTSPVINTINSTAIIPSSEQITENESSILAKQLVAVTSDPQQAHVLLAREGIDEECEGCGLYGHNVYKTGCDRCAQFLLIQRYLDRNPKQSKFILTKYKQHQQELMKERQKRQESRSFQRSRQNNNSASQDKRRQPYSGKSRKARVQTLQAAIENVLQSDSESSNDAESFNSAESHEGQTESQE